LHCQFDNNQGFTISLHS